MKKSLFFGLYLACALFIHVSALNAAKSPSTDYWHADGTDVMHFVKPLQVDGLPSGLSGVDCIYLINLDRRPERLKRMKEILDAYQLHFQRVQAVDGRHLSSKTKQALFGDYPVRMSNGAIGCLLSHLSILQDAFERGYPCIWILEDDVFVKEDPHVLAPLLQELEHLDPNWDLLFTDPDAKSPDGHYVRPITSDFRPGQPRYPISYFQKKQKVGPFFRIRQRYGTWSLFVSRRGIEKLLDYYQHVHLWGVYDVDLFYTPTLRCYTTSRDIVTQCLGGDSDTTN